MAKKIRAIQQLEAAECGVACLAMILDLHGASIPLDELRSHCGTSRDGNSALQILQAAKGLGMMGRGLKLTLEQLAAVKTPLLKRVSPAAPIWTVRPVAPCSTKKSTHPVRATISTSDATWIGRYLRREIWKSVGAIIRMSSTGVRPRRRFPSWTLLYYTGT